MIPKKKLQVFVSSTYLDLKEERQAAVEAILSAGHIPAGMELFSAGDKSQWDTITRWIDDSDVYMLIVGGRYGSVEAESGKSYTQLEYEYAISKGKPFFGLVITEEALDVKVNNQGKGVLELSEPHKFTEFVSLVKSRVVRFWSNSTEIKLFVMESLNMYSRNDELIGWVPGSSYEDTNALALQIARLEEENSKLRELARATEEKSGKRFGNYTEAEMNKIFICKIKGSIFTHPAPPQFNRDFKIEFEEMSKPKHGGHFTYGQFLFFIFIVGVLPWGTLSEDGQQVVNVLQRIGIIYTDFNELSLGLEIQIVPEYEPYFQRLVFGSVFER